MALYLKDELFDVIHWRVIRQEEDRFDLLMKGEYLTVIVPSYYTDENITVLFESNVENIYQALSISKQLGEPASVIRIHPDDYKQILEDASHIRETVYRRFKKRVDKYAELMEIPYSALQVDSLENALSDSDSDKGTIILDCLLHVMTEQTLDAMIVHELCHLKYPKEGHSDAFRDEEEKWNSNSDDLYDLEKREQLRIGHLIFGNCDVYDEHF